MKNYKQGMLLHLLFIVVVLLNAGCGSVGSIGISSEDADVTGDEGAVKGKSPATVYVQLAGEYLRLGETKSALENAKKAVVVDPGNSNGSTILALVYQQLGENKLAEKHFKRALRIDGQDADAANAYGSFLCGSGRYEEADKYFQRAMTNPLYRTPWVPVNNAGMCARSQGDIEKAAGYFETSLSFRPQFSSALLNAAGTHYDLGKYRSASGYLQSYLSRRPSNAKTLALAAKIEHKLGEPAKAASYEMLLRNNYPNSEEARSLTGAY